MARAPLECRGSWPWREPPMVHTVSLILVLMGMVVGSRWVDHQKRGCAKLRVGRLWSQHCAKNCGDSDPVRRRRKRSAPRAYRLYRTCPPPPLGWALPTVSSGWWRERAYRALVPNSPGLPSPRPNRPHLLTRPARRQIAEAEATMLAGAQGSMFLSA